MDKAYNESKKARKGSTVLEESALAHLVGDVRIALDGQKVENPLFHAVKLVEGDEIEVEMHKETVGMVDEFKKRSPTTFSGPTSRRSLRTRDTSTFPNILLPRSRTKAKKSSR
ncbi:MAG: hypothetical protein ACLUSP_08240 [Christensenellales bacterium]